MSQPTMSQPTMSKSLSKPVQTVIAVGLGLLLAACGSNPKERGLSGGAIGAGTGAVIGAVTGLSVLQGVAIGAGIGAVTGAVTSQDQINLGSLNSGSGSGARNSAANTTAPSGVTLAASPLVEDVQAALGRAGYDPGPADGVAGPRTSRAITAYQRDNGLTADGEPSAVLLQHLLSRKT